MSTFDDDERSTSQNRPIELYTIVTPTAVYRLTSHNVDVTFGGNLFTALTLDRGPHQIAADLTGRELIVYLPVTHPLVQRFAATGIPERQVLVTLQRLQEVSGIAVRVWQGFGTGMQISGALAKLRVPSVTDDAMRIKLPVVAGQRLCNHRLFDARCAPNPGSDGPAAASFEVSGTLVSQTGTTLVVSTMSEKPDGWASLGDVVHLATGERRFILVQAGTTLTLASPFVDANPGDALAVFAGCDHAITTCRDKFANVTNFGGHPEMTTSINPWLPKGIGVVVQT
jgi:Phage conserved hypothetical protein BR0599